MGEYYVTVQRVLPWDAWVQIDREGRNGHEPNANFLLGFAFSQNLSYVCASVGSQVFEKLRNFFTIWFWCQSLSDRERERDEINIGYTKILDPTTKTNPKKKSSLYIISFFKKKKNVHFFDKISSPWCFKKAIV